MRYLCRGAILARLGRALQRRGSRSLEREQLPARNLPEAVGERSRALVEPGPCAIPAKRDTGQRSARASLLDAPSSGGDTCTLTEAPPRLLSDGSSA